MLLVGVVIVCGLFLLFGWWCRSGLNDLSQTLRDEQRLGRTELRDQLESISRALSLYKETMSRHLDEVSRLSDQRFSQVSNLQTEHAKDARDEIARAQHRSAEIQSERMKEVQEQMSGLRQEQETRILAFGQQLTDGMIRLEAQFQGLRQDINSDAARLRQENAASSQAFTQSLSQQLSKLSQQSESHLDKIRATLEQQLRYLQNDNAQKLEKMRETVDEKLQLTLSKRLDASFQLVSERLEQVQHGLGEMQHLANGVGDLKRVLTNVKNRGNWGEVQLETLLEGTLATDQYQRHVRVDPTQAEQVDFAVRLPGRDPALPEGIWLPIDAKFPRDDYERLMEAQDRGDADNVRLYAQQFERALRIQARSIAQKYIVQPYTTDFAVMFLPTEGLYAEALRRAGLVDSLQREHRVVLAGPTTITALLNSLQMGFKTLAIEKRSGEVWGLLGAVKSEFGKFAGILEKAEKQIVTVSRSLGEASRKSRTIERRLRGVESIPHQQLTNFIPDDETLEAPITLDDAYSP